MLQTKFGVKAIEHDSSIEWCYAHNITQWHGPSEYNNEMLGALSESFSPCEGFSSLRLLYHEYTENEKLTPYACLRWSQKLDAWFQVYIQNPMHGFYVLECTLHQKIIFTWNSTWSSTMWIWFVVNFISQSDYFMLSYRIPCGWTLTYIVIKNMCVYWWPKENVNFMLD